MVVLFADLTMHEVGVQLSQPLHLQHPNSYYSVVKIVETFPSFSPRQWRSEENRSSWRNVALRGKRSVSRKSNECCTCSLPSAALGYLTCCWQFVCVSKMVSESEKLSFLCRTGPTEKSGPPRKGERFLLLFRLDRTDLFSFRRKFWSSGLSPWWPSPWHISLWIDFSAT